MVYLGEQLSKDSLHHLRKGDVLLWRSFKFKNKERDSRFVILSECDECDNFFVIRATANMDFYQKGRLKRDVIRIQEGKEDALPKLTVLDFSGAHRILNVQDMVKLYDGEIIKRVGRLSDGLLDEIDELVKKSKLIESRWKNQILNSKRSDLKE